MICKHIRSPIARGFTLVELLVVMAIVAILAAIAIPSYSAYVQRSRIIEATSSLADFRVRMEQFFLDNRRYTAGAACGIADPTSTGSESFDVKCAAADDRTYKVTATGIAAKNMKDFIYSIDQNGRKKTESLPKGWAGGTTDGCWVNRKDGSCI
jgi:type IV pilus assembly protein PilE